MAPSPQLLALQYGLRLDASTEFIRGYVDGMRLDQRGQGVACGRGWIPRSKKCSRDKASATPKEAKARTVEKSRERAKLKGEVNAAKGQKPQVKDSDGTKAIREAGMSIAKYPAGYTPPPLTKEQSSQLLQNIKTGLANNPNLDVSQYEISVGSNNVAHLYDRKRDVSLSYLPDGQPFKGADGKVVINKGNPVEAQSIYFQKERSYRPQTATDKPYTSKSEAQKERAKMARRTYTQNGKKYSNFTVPVVGGNERRSIEDGIYEYNFNQYKVEGGEVYRPMGDGKAWKKLSRQSRDPALNKSDVLVAITAPESQNLVTRRA